jgi:hypothetical protein
LAAPTLESIFNDWRQTMGKYFIAWLLGVPGVLLVLLYLFFH